MFAEKDVLNFINNKNITDKENNNKFLEVEISSG